MARGLYDPALMRSPRSFFAPLALGAPEPLREIPVKPSRMIHFLDFSNEKMVAKAADIATKTLLSGETIASASASRARSGSHDPGFDPGGAKSHA